MTAKRTRDDGRIPDLGSGSDSPARPSKSSELGGVASGDAFFGSGNFDAGDFGDSLDLALDDGADVRSGPRATPDASEHGDVIERTAEGVRSLPARPVGDDGHWPTGVSPSSASIEIEPAEIALTAEYGSSPTSPLGTPAYAVRTLRRRRTLTDRVRERSDALATAEAARDRLLVDLIATLDPVLRGNADGRRLLEPVIRIEALALERRSALTGVSAEYERRLAELDAESAALDGERATSRDALERAAAVLAERKHAHERLEARKKRLYIEVRGLLDAVEKAGGRATAEQAALIQAREADVAAQKPELERAEQAAREAADAHAAASLTARDVARRLTELSRKQGGLATEFEKQAGTHAHGVDEAEAHRTQAAVDAARAVLAARGRIVDVPRSTRDELRRADEGVAAAARDLERHVRAVDSYDHAAVTTGLAIVAAVAAAVILVLLLAIR